MILAYRNNKRITRKKPKISRHKIFEEGRKAPKRFIGKISDKIQWTVTNGDVVKTA